VVERARKVDGTGGGVSIALMRISLAAVLFALFLSSAALGEAVPRAAVAAAASPADGPHARASRILFGSGLAFLATAGGLALYSSQAGGHDTASIVSAALAATGAGAIVGSGLLLALTPSGAALQGSF
jgi:hypothetical protein